MLFIEYPKCSTCKKAKKYLDDNLVNYTDRNIVLDNPTKEELDKWITASGKDINKFFNTSGMKYRELNLKDKLPDLSYEEKLEILASDGMLVKRPVLVEKSKVLVGFKENEWNEIKKAI
jgi:arsenate reductase